LDATLAKWNIQHQIKTKTHENQTSKPTRINNVMFDPPKQADYGFFFETFRISCGELVEQVRTLRIGVGAI
jgi:hypothetical protein